MKLFSHSVFLIMFFFFSATAFAQVKNEEIQTTFEYTKKVKEQLNAIKKIPPKDYFNKVDDYRVSLEKYMENKKRVCEGEFSTVILESDNSTEPSNSGNKSNKLSAEERKLCFRELKALQVTFINNMFVARKNYLTYLHEKRLEELKMAREQAIKNIQMSFSKKRR